MGIPEGQRRGRVFQAQRGLHRKLDLGPSPCPSEPLLVFMPLGVSDPSLGKDSVGWGPGAPSPLPSAAQAVGTHKDFSRAAAWPGLTPFGGLRSQPSTYRLPPCQLHPGHTPKDVSAWLLP